MSDVAVALALTLGVALIALPIIWIEDRLRRRR